MNRAALILGLMARGKQRAAARKASCPVRTGGTDTKRSRENSDA